MKRPTRNRFLNWPIVLANLKFELVPVSEHTIRTFKIVTRIKQVTHFKEDSLKVIGILQQASSYSTVTILSTRHLFQAENDDF